jgi:uncharacterized delta-60 repeat protein
MALKMSNGQIAALPKVSGVLLALAVALFMLAPAKAHAAPGGLDTSFGGDGIVTTDLGSSRANAIALLSSGKFLVGGEADGNFALLRYNADGTLDTDFGGGDGIVTTDLGGAYDSARGLEVQPDGKIVLAGRMREYGEPSSDEFAVARYDADGTLDSSFGGGDGKATADFNPEGDEAGALVLLPDGKIVLAGRTYTGISRFALARFNSDGSLDGGFGSGGKVDGGPGSIFGLAAQPDGKLVVAGQRGADFTVGRFNSDGSIDTSFGVDGVVSKRFGGKQSSNAVDVALQDDGKIVASGWGGWSDAVIARYTSNGSMDTSFGGGDGVTYSRFGIGSSGSAIALGLQPDGKILTAGQWRQDEDFGPDDFGIARYNANGELDPGFGDDGFVTTDVAGGSGENVASDLAVQPDGKIIAAGGSGYDTYDIALVRYEGGDTPVPTYHQLLLSKGGAGTGEMWVHPSRSALHCGENCGADVVAGETVTIYAEGSDGSEPWWDPEPASTFTGWTTTSGDPGTCIGAVSPCDVTLDADVRLVANFSVDGGPPPGLVDLAVVRAGTGTGSVTSTPAGIDCGSICEGEFDDGEVVSLTATAASGSSFAGWSGGGCSGAGTCQVTMDSDTTVTATFEPSGGGPGPTDPGPVGTQPSSGAPSGSSGEQKAERKRRAAGKKARAKKRALKRCQKLKGKAKRKCVKRAGAKKGLSQLGRDEVR